MICQVEYTIKFKVDIPVEDDSAGWRDHDFESRQPTELVQHMRLLEQARSWRNDNVSLLDVITSDVKDATDVQGRIAITPPDAISACIEWRGER